MRVYHLALTMFCLLFLTPLLLVAFPMCSGQQTNQSGLKVTVDEYGWTNEMKQNFITTPERRLVLRFTITNTGSQPLSISTLDISITIKSTEMVQNGYQQTEPTVFSKDLPFNSLYLLSGESTYNSVQVISNAYGYSYASSDNLTIGSYTATLTYTTTSPDQYGGGTSIPTPIEPAPLNFRVASESEMQTVLQQNKGGTTFIFSPQIQVDLIGGGVSITVIAAAAGYILKRNRRRH